MIHWTPPNRAELIKLAHDYRAEFSGARQVNDKLGPWAEPFIEHANETFAREGFEYQPGAARNYFLSVIKSTDLNTPPDGWVRKFPHAHGKPSVTLVHYLQVPEAGGELVIAPGEPGEVVVTPEAGLSVIMEDTVNHGVREVVGDVDRVTIIALQFREVM
jgi:hypothetical protein